MGRRARAAGSISGAPGERTGATLVRACGPAAAPLLAVAAQSTAGGHVRACGARGRSARAVVHQGATSFREDDARMRRAGGEVGWVGLPLRDSREEGAFWGGCGSQASSLLQSSPQSSPVLFSSLLPVFSSLLQSSSATNGVKGARILLPIRYGERAGTTPGAVQYVLCANSRHSAISPRCRDTHSYCENATTNTAPRV